MRGERERQYTIIMTTPFTSIEEICDWLNGSVSTVVATMFSSEVLAVPPLDSHRTKGPLVVGSVGFVGEMSGVVYLSFSTRLAQVLASRMLGLTDAELGGDEIVNDVIAELSNMVVGGVKSRLCDSGCPCFLTIPSVMRGQNLEVQTVKPTESRLLGFQCGTEHFTVELQIKRSK